MLGPDGRFGRGSCSKVRRICGCTAERLIRRLEPLERLGGYRIAGVLVGVIFLRQAPIRAPNLLGRSTRLKAKLMIMALRIAMIGHRRSWAFILVSPVIDFGFCQSCDADGG